VLRIILGIAFEIFFIRKWSGTGSVYLGCFG